MILTTKSRYGTRLILDLALYARNDPVRLSEISRRQGISLKYLEKLISKLKKAGFVKSTRGLYGGYMLAKPAEKISVGDIVKVLEGTDSIIDCAERDNVCSVCSRAGKCLTRWIWSEASTAMFKKLNSFKINKLIEDPDQILKNSITIL